MLACCAAHDWSHHATLHYSLSRCARSFHNCPPCSRALPGRALASFLSLHRPQVEMSMGNSRSGSRRPSPSLQGTKVPIPVHVNLPRDIFSPSLAPVLGIWPRRVPLPRLQSTATYSHGREGLRWCTRVTALACSRMNLSTTGCGFFVDLFLAAPGLVPLDLLGRQWRHRSGLIAGEVRQ